MMDMFPSVPIMFGLNTVIIAITIAVTLFIYRLRRDIKHSRAILGAALVLGGLWVQTAIYIADFYSMSLMPALFGMDRAMSFMTDLHTIYSWYASTVAVAMIAVGLAMMLFQMLKQTRQQGEQLRLLQLNQDHFHQAAQLAKVGYYIYDPIAEKMEFFTDTHAHNHGVEPAEYATKASTLENGMPLIHPEDRQSLMDGYERVQRGETVYLAYRAIGGDELRHCREIVKPIYGDDGTIVQELGTTIDVTEHIETDKLMFFAQRNEAIGQLTGGVAHDFNNLLAVVMGNVELLAEELKMNKVDPAIWEEMTNSSLTAAARGADLVKSLLSFSRQANLNPETVSLNDLISETDGWLRRTLRSNIETEVSLHAGLWNVMIDRGEAQNALVNLVLNAQHAMPEGGKLTIETSNVHITEDYIRDRDEEVEEGRYVLVAISDTGIGIADTMIERIFDPFVSTRPPGEGSGLGLSMVQGFVRQSGGAIRVYSEEGTGTTFKLYFPASGKVSARPGPRTVKLDEGLRTGARVLFAEDQKDVMDIILRSLSQAGLTVEAAMTGDEALEIFKADRDFDLLLTDIVMPGDLQGPGLAKEIRKLVPEMPVVFLSGYATEAAIHGNGLRPEDIRLMKPVPKAALLDAVKKALRNSKKS